MTIPSHPLSQQDPVAEVSNVEKPAAISSNGETYFIDKVDHRPDAKEDKEKSINFIIDNV